MAKITTLPTAKAFYPKDLKKPSRLSDNNGGGEPPMDNKYVTHQELELSNEKMLRHIDNKFADMQSKRFGFMEPALPLYPLLVPLLGF